MKKVLFVCTANVYRSPMARAIFDALAKDRCLIFETESVGVEALEGAPMDPKVSAALSEIGISAESHHA